MTDGHDPYEGLEKYPVVTTLWGGGPPVDITDLEAMVELLGDSGEFLGPRKQRPKQGTSDGAPVDVDQRLADVNFQGPGDTGVHNTELSCTASLLRKGMSVEAATLTVIEEMRRSMVHDPRINGWDWESEEHKIRGQCMDFISKNSELSRCLPDYLREKFETTVRQGRTPKLIFNRVHGWQVRGYIEEKSPEQGDKVEVPKYRFKLVSFADLRPGPEPLYLVDELMPIAGLVDVWGKAKCFKSFWCLDLMLHVAMGWEYRDRCVHQGAIVYCAFEGAHGYKKRIEAQRRHYNIEDSTHVPLYVMPGQANLITEHRVLIADIAAQLVDVKPAAVVLDTLNKSLVGSESKDVDMGAYVRAAEAIRDKFGCVVIIVHHCGYDETRPRGHSSLPGAVDAQLSVVRSENVITVTVEMMRDGPEDTQVVSEVQSIEVGVDQNGKTLTSLAVMPSEADPADIGQGLPRGLLLFRTALKAALASHGEAFQPEAGVLPVRAVDQKHVRDRYCKTYGEEEEDAKKRASKLRQAFNRALHEAQGRGMVRVQTMDTGACSTMLWLPERGEA